MTLAINILAIIGAASIMLGCAAIIWGAYWFRKLARNGGWTFG